MKFSLVPKDAVGFEKFVYIFVELGVVILYAVAQLSVWGVLNNTLTSNAKTALPFWHIVGFLLLLFSLVWGYGGATDRNYVTKSGLGNVLILWLAMVLSIAASCGFHFNG